MASAPKSHATARAVPGTEDASSTSTATNTAAAAVAIAPARADTTPQSSTRSAVMTRRTVDAPAAPAASAPDTATGGGRRGLKVSIVGSGNWGSAASTIIGRNAKRLALFNPTVRMWCFEEMVDGKKLSETINTTHVNVKYLPRHTLPENVVAVPDVADACIGADVLVFVVPHQFLAKTCATLKGKLAPNAVAISLIKGIDFDAKGVVLMSDVIERELGVPCSVLSGANIADEIADGKFCESTIGFTSPEAGSVFYNLFNAPKFRISLIEDVAGVQVFGALKNVVALGAGFVDALEYGNNTKAALIRIGLLEIGLFAQHYFEKSNPLTMVESAGVADLITTCSGGRNRKVAEAFMKAEGKRSWEELEKEMLGGQKLQGTSTCEEVMEIIKRDNNQAKFPLITIIYNIAFRGAPAETIVDLPMNPPHADVLLQPMHSHL
jgi:glycerol-3-phosphate dehydrogenase (NAD+)